MRKRVEIHCGLVRQFTQRPHSPIGFWRRTLNHPGKQVQFACEKSEPLPEIVMEFPCETSALVFLSTNQASTKFNAFLLSRPALCHVENHSYHAERLPRVMVVGLPSSVYPTNFAVGPHCAQINKIGSAVLETITPVPDHTVAVVRMQRIDKRLESDLAVCGRTKHVAGFLVPIQSFA